MTGEPRPFVLHTRVVVGTGGGPEKTIFNSPRFLRPLGYDAACAYMHPPDDPGFAELRRRAEAAGAELIGLPDRGPLDFGLVRRFAALCRERRVAVWHGHDYKSNLLGLLVRRRHPMRLVTTVHGWVRFTRRTPLYYAVDRWSMRRYDRIVCVSDDLHDRCLAAGVPPDRVVTIENAIDAGAATRTLDRTEAKRRLGVVPGRFLIAAAGRLSDEKGFDRLIAAVGRLVAAGIDAELVIAGEGDRLEPLRRLAAESGLADRVRLLGFVADLSTLYQAADAFALSSLREGLPNVLLEAMAYGAPVVSTRVAGTVRLIADGADGLLVEPDDPAALAAALRRLHDDPGLRDRLAAAARRTIETCYDFAVRMRKMAAVYDAVLAGASASPAG